MTEWYAFSIAALVLMGVQRFLYKVSAERNCPTLWTTFSFMATVTVLSAIFLAALKEPLSDVRMLAAMALLNSASFVLGTITHIEALKHVPAGVVYPILRLNMVVVVLFGVFVFRDRLSLLQILGILLAVAVMLILRKDTEHAGDSVGNVRRGLVLLFVSLLCGSVASISSKYAALYAGKLGFMALSYFLGALFSAGLITKSGSKGNPRERKEAVLIGIVMGVINFAGFYAFLAALSAGPLAVIVPITGMHFVIAVMLSVILYKEKLGPRRVLGIALTVVSVLFLRS